VPGQVVGGVEPVDLACPEDVIFWRDGVRIVERDDAEVERFGLVIDRYEQRRSALGAK
jgi:hypothetical protein